MAQDRQGVTGNGDASHAWKGGSMRVKFAHITLLVLLVVGTSYGLDVSVNGTSIGNYTPSELAGLSYPLSQGGGVGVSLTEILPPMVDVHRIDIITGGGRSSWTEPGLAGKLRDYSIRQMGALWTLDFGGIQFQGVRRIDVWGERISERELEVWISWEGTNSLKDEIRGFAGRHGLDIKVVDVPAIRYKLITVQRGRGTLPDVVMLSSGDIPALTDAKVLQSLDYMVPRGMRGFEAFRTSDGKTWAVPFYLDTQLLFYNTELVDIDLGSRWTLADLESHAQKLLEKPYSDRGVIPMAWNAYSVYWLIPFQMGFGKIDLLAPDGGIRIDDEPTRRAVEYVIDLHERGLLEYLEREAMISRFASGRIGMILTGSYSIPQFEELGIPFDVAPYPDQPETGKPISPMLDFKGLGITRKTRRPLLARRLIEHLTGEGVQQRFPVSLHKLPANTAVWQNIESRGRYFASLKESVSIGTVVPPARAYDVYKSTMWKLLRLALSGQMSVAEALAEGQRMIDLKLEEQQ